MRKLLWFIRRVSLTGIGNVQDERLRFEIISVNQFNLMAFLLASIVTIFHFIFFPLDWFHGLRLLYTAAFLVTFYLHRSGRYFWGKIVLIINVGLFYFINGLVFGTSSQAQTVYVLIIAYILLFFSRQSITTKSIMLLPAVLLPASLFYFEQVGVPALMFTEYAQPAYMGPMTFLLVIIAAIVLFIITQENMNLMERKLNKTKVDLINANAQLRTDTSEMSNTLRSAAHDLRSPVTSALSLAELLQNEEDTNNRQQMEQHLHESLHKLKQLVDEILASEDAGYQLMDLTQVDLEEELAQVLSLLKHYPGFRKINMEVDVEQDVPLITDQKYLNVILSNLISNAIKYADASEPRSYIEVKGRIDKHLARLEIKDNGIGIPEEKLPHVFKRNIRGTDLSEGTGLGLAIVKRTVQILDGDIRLNSKEGEGTTVKLELNNAYDRM